jgi:hypothetical protein
MRNPNEDRLGLASRLIAMAEEDQRVRAELAADGSLFQGYHPRMREVHDRNAAELREIIEKDGWPVPRKVGEEASRAAWLVLQHAIGHPELQRTGLRLLKQAAATGEIPMQEPAMLEDRIRVFEGRPQIYGSQYDWDENGEMSPSPLEDPARVDELRKSAGFELTVAENTERIRSSMGKESRPPDFVEHRRGYEAWLREVGWRK